MRCASLVMMGVLGLALGTFSDAFAGGTLSGADGARPVVAVAVFAGKDAPARLLSEIVAADLARAGRVEVVRLERTMSDREQPQGEPTFVLAGSVSPEPDGRLATRARLWQPGAAGQLGGQRVIADASELRRVAHQLADWVEAKLTGVPGMHSRWIARVVPREGRHALILTDSDGQGERLALVSPKPLAMPVWSPTTEGPGKALAYFSFESGQPQLFVQEITTGQRAPAEAPAVRQACAKELSAFEAADTKARERWADDGWSRRGGACAAALHAFMARRR